MWNVLKKQVNFGEPTSFLDHVYLGCTQRQCETSKLWTITQPYSNPVFPQEQRKNYQARKNCTFLRNLRYGRSCQEMRGTLLWVGKQNDSTTLQSINSMSRWPWIQIWRIEIRGRIVKCVLSNCSEMTFGTPMVSQQTCTCDHKMDQSMWQTSSTFDLLHSFHEWVRTVLSCGKYCTTIQIRTVSRLGLFRRSWRFEIDFRWNVVYFRKPHICACKLYVQETDMCVTQFNGSWNSFSGCRCLRMDGISALDLWDLIIDVLQKRLNSQNKTPVSKENLELSNVDFVSSNAKSCHKGGTLYIFEDNQAVIKMIIKGRSPTMRHVSRTQRVALDWWFDRINLDPKIQIKCVDTKTQLADILNKGNFTRDEWSHLLCLFNISLSALQAALKRCRKGRRRNGEERIAAKSKPINDKSGSSTVPISTASSSPGSFRS